MLNGQMDRRGIIGDMSRQSDPVTSALGQAMRDRRGSRSGTDQAAIVGIAERTYYRTEGGTRKPSLPTARAIARWLGWSIDEVADAAEKPPTP